MKGERKSRGGGGRADDICASPADILSDDRVMGWLGKQLMRRVSAGWGYLGQG